MSAITTVAQLRQEDVGEDARATGVRLAEALDRCERDHDQIVLSAGTLPARR